VAFPAFSRVQDDLEMIRHGYTKSLTYISTITFPLLAGLMVVAPEFIPVVFGGKWDAAVVPVQVLCPMAILRSVGTTRGSLFQARGRADIELKWNIFYFFPFSAAVFIGSRYGLNGATFAYTLIFLIGFPVIQYITNRLINLRAKRYFKSLTPTFISMIIMAVAVMIVRILLHTYFNVGNLIILISSVLTGAAVYYFALNRIDNRVIRELWNILVNRKISQPAITQP
jgi:O-antigen/teichoic acid export membrane protein